MKILATDGTVIQEMSNLVGTKKEDLSNVPKGEKLERTGENFTSTYTIVGGLGLVLAVGMLTLKKKELEA